MNTALNQTQLREGEFEVLKSLQSDKASGLNVHVITSVYGFTKMPLLKIFNESLILGVLSENWKIAKLAPIFKSDRNELLSNYRLISVLFCFSKIMEKIVYNGLYRYVHDNNLFLINSLVFCLSNSMCDSFSQNKYILGIFIDLLKASDTIDYNVLNKLSLYSIKNKGLN